MQHSFITWITKGRRSSARALVAPTFDHPKLRLWLTAMSEAFKNNENLRVVDRDFDNSKTHFLLNMMKDISLHLLMSKERPLMQSVDPAIYDRHMSTSLTLLKEALWLEP